MDDLFLSEAQVKELTGIRRGRAGQRAAELQVKWCLDHGIAAHLNAAQRAIVLRSSLEGRQASRQAKPTAEWTPNAWR